MFICARTARRAGRRTRARVLDSAYNRTPERFVRRPPRPPALPTAAWINKPETEEVAH
jgi:putative transposase